ncbi:MAG: FAD:protein FMN transferase [Candidatus Saccharimonadales bacterium]
MSKRTQLIMGMPISLEIVGSTAAEAFRNIFNYFRAVDKRFSTYKKSSEISQINNGLPKSKWSAEMTSVLQLCAQTKAQTNGYFDISHAGKLDPSGLVKGWAIQNAAQQLLTQGFKNFCIEAGGDIQACGRNSDNLDWSVGIRNPFNLEMIIKTLAISNLGVATSGTYVRGQHIYDPYNPKRDITQVKSLTVIGPNIYEADRFATAAFAMGKKGVEFIESTKGLEGYMVDDQQLATYTSGFESYTTNV